MDGGIQQEENEVELLTRETQKRSNWYWLWLNGGVGLYQMSVLYGVEGPSCME